MRRSMGLAAGNVIRRPRVRTSPMLLATATCLAVLLTVAGSGSAAFGSSSRTAAIRSVVPAGFHAQSLSWVSATNGWMLGSAPCGQATCTTVVGTTDGGATWNQLGTLDAPLTMGEDKTGLSEVRFVDDLHGWAFGPALWATNDGGATWTRHKPPGGRQVLALEGDADAVYVVTSACRFNYPPSMCSYPATLWRKTPDHGSWTQVSLTLPVINQAILAVHGLVAYLVVPMFDSPDPDLLFATVDGQQWSPRPPPCKKGQGEFLSDVAPISDTKVALLCQANIGFGKAEKRVLRSQDTGQTTSSAGTLPLYGIVSQLAAAPNGTLVVTSYSISSWIYRNAGGRIWTTPVDGIDLGEGWNDVVFTTNQIGFVIHAPATCCGHSGVGELGQTVDGGVTWTPI
jgi:hypothetical protein